MIHEAQSLLTNNAYGSLTINTIGHTRFPNIYPLSNNLIPTTAINARAICWNDLVIEYHRGSPTWDVNYRLDTLGKTTAVVFIRQDEISKGNYNAYWTLMHLPYPFMIPDHRRAWHSITGDFNSGIQNFYINNLSLLKIQELTSGLRVLFVFDYGQTPDVNSNVTLTIGNVLVNSWTNRPNGGADANIIGALDNLTGCMNQEITDPKSFRQNIDYVIEKFYRYYATYGFTYKVTELLREFSLKYVNVTTGINSTNRTNNDIYRRVEKSAINIEYDQIYTEASYTIAQATGILHCMTSATGIIPAVVYDARNNTVNHFSLAHFNPIRYLLKSVKYIVEDNINEEMENNPFWDGLRTLSFTHKLSFEHAAFCDEKYYRCHMPMMLFIDPWNTASALIYRKHFRHKKRAIYNLNSASTFLLNGNELNVEMRTFNGNIAAILAYDFDPVHWVMVKRTNEYYIIKYYGDAGVIREIDQNKLYIGFQALMYIKNMSIQRNVNASDWLRFRLDPDYYSNNQIKLFTNESGLQIQNWYQYFLYLHQLMQRLEYTSFNALVNNHVTWTSWSLDLALPLTFNNFDFMDQWCSFNRNFRNSLYDNKHAINGNGLIPQRMAFPLFFIPNENQVWSIQFKVNSYQIFYNHNFEGLRFHPWKFIALTGENEMDNKDQERSNSLNQVLDLNNKFLSF